MYCLQYCVHDRFSLFPCLPLRGIRFLIRKQKREKFRESVQYVLL